MRVGRVGLVAAALSVLATGPVMAQKAASGYRGPIIDTHAHISLGADDKAMAEQPTGTEALRKLDEAAGVTVSALIVMARKGQLERTRSQNDAVIEAAKNSNGHFFPIGSVHPDDGQAALDELDRIAAAGVKMIKLHPNTQKLDITSPAVDAVMSKLEERGMIVLFDAYSPWDANQLGNFLMLGIKHPKARLVLAHMGGSRFRDDIMFGIGKKFPWYPNNIWFDLSAIVPVVAGSPLQDEFVWLLRLVGTDRVLFATDWPVFTPAEVIASVRKLKLTPAEEKQVFHDNAAALLGLPAAK